MTDYLILGSFLLLLGTCTQAPPPLPPPPSDPLSTVDGLVLECLADTTVFSLVDPIRLQGVVINHSLDRTIPFVQVPMGAVYNLRFKVQNLKDQAEFVFTDFDLAMGRGGLLDGGNVNLRVSPGDTVRAFTLDLQRMQHATKEGVDARGAPLPQTLELEPGGVYAFSWTVTGAVHLVSRPFLFRIRS